MTLTQIREGIAANLSAIAGWQVSPYMLASPTPPSIHVFPDTIEYDKVMKRGLDDWFILVQAFVGTTSDIGAQQKLDEMLAPSGATSIKAAIESDKTLGGAVSSLQVVSCSGYRVYPRPGSSDAAVLGAEWRVHVLG